MPALSKLASMHIIESEACRSRNQKATLTIAIPTWNRADHLMGKLDAIAECFGTVPEVIVCDNGSTDQTWNRLSDEVATNRLALKCFRNVTNLGCDANYMRALEAATGEWTWLIGDDDPLDFHGFQADVEPLLSQAKADIVLLSGLDELASIKGKVHSMSVALFFDQSMDLCSGYILKISRSICRTEQARKWLSYAYRHGMGSLHSYSYVYGELFRESGIDIIYSALLFGPDPYDNHRWDVLQGHLGAWKTSLAIFRPYKQYVRAREKRLRAHLLIEAARDKLYQSESIRPWFFFVIRELPMKYRIKLVYHLSRSRLLRISLFSAESAEPVRNQSDY